MMQINTRPINRLEYKAYKPKIVKTDNGFQEYCKYCTVKIPQGFRFCPTCRKGVLR